MSFSPQDWKRFDVLSGQLRIVGTGTDDEVIVNAENGTWVAMCEYDDDCRISTFAAMPERMAEMMADGRVEVEGVEEHATLEAVSGMIFASDRKACGVLPDWWKVPEYRLNPSIVEMYGRPDDDGKSAEDRFVEACFHMGCDCRAGNMPVLEEVGFGTVCKLRGGELDVGLLYNVGRDVIGVEVISKR